jgi:2'-5' RNA ligase
LDAHVESVRLFVGVFPPVEVADHLAGQVARLRVGRAAAAGVNPRLAPRERWHVTLAFLGEVPDDRLGAAQAAVGAAAARVRPFGVRLSGGGRFGRGRFAVLWVGLGGDLPHLDGLAGGVRRELRRARLPFDPKPLRPHLTLARPGGRVPAADVDADWESLRAYRGPDWTVSTVELVRSRAGPHPHYERLASFALSAAS